MTNQHQDVGTTFIEFLEHLIRTPDAQWREASTLLPGSLGGMDEEHRRFLQNLRWSELKHCVTLPEALVLRLFDRLRALKGGSRMEDEVWATVVRLHTEPLPLHVGLPLASEYGYYWTRLALAHSRQHEEVHRALAARDPHARHAWAQRILGDAAFSEDDLAGLLALYGDDEKTVGLLARTRSSGPEKRARLERFLRETREGELLREHLEAMEATHAAFTTDADEIARLYDDGRGRPEVLLALARNPATPDAVLRTLEAAERIPRAKEIRHHARRTRERREGQGGG